MSDRNGSAAAADIVTVRAALAVERTAAAGLRDEVGRCSLTL